MNWRVVSAAILSIFLWELAKLAIGRVFAIEYYKRESETVVIRMRLMPWDKAGRKHFEEQGYSRQFPVLPTERGEGE